MTFPLSRRLRGAVVWVMSGLACATAQAALNITPPQLAPDENGIVSTEVKSSLDRPTRWSVRAIAWDPNQKDSAEPSATAVSATANPAPVADVDISPRFFSLSAAGRQVIRARVNDRSRHYRLLIEQIPLDTPGAQGVNFRFRFSLPIYRSGQDPLIPRGIVIQ